MSSTFFAVLGLLRHLVFAYCGLAAQLPSVLEGADIQVTGRVVGLPRTTDFGLQYVFLVASSDREFSGRVLLSDYEAEAGGVLAGQQRTMVVRLKKPYGTANPGAFDREGELFRKKIRATGYVRATLSAKNSHVFSLPMLREKLLIRLREYTSESEFGGIIEALILGERGRITREQSQLFAVTGTSHLMVISGLHIGLVAGLAYGAACYLLSLIPSLGVYLPRQKMATLFSLFAALAYSAMAGFTLPTLRALTMLLAFMLAQLFNRKISISLRWLIALAGVLSLDPLATQSPGFWFSFLGVASLIVLIDHQSIRNDDSLGRQSPFGAVLLGWLKPQFTVFVALLLPLLLFGLPVSLLSPFINIVAIPILGIVLVPLCLGFGVSIFIDSGLASWVHALLENCLMGLSIALTFISTSSLGQIAAATINIYPLDWVAAAMATLATAILVFPASGSVRLLAVPMLLPIFWPVQSDPSSPLKVDVLDVGQGLAVLLRTEHHSLIYDTGNGRDGGFSAGSAIIAPTLLKMGVNHLDRVVISHGDTDHAGGLSGLLAVMPTKSIMFGEPLPLSATNGVSCHEFAPWTWDGVNFRFLQLSERGSGSNENSCVLHVTVGGVSVLLPGDIGNQLEKRLVSKYGAGLNSALLIAPHHGSKTSSSYPFIKTVQPDLVVFSTGYRNRFNHPADNIVNRYAETGVSAFNTATSGLLSFELVEIEAGPSVRGELPMKFGPAREYRQTQARYWRCHETCR